MNDTSDLTTESRGGLKIHPPLFAAVLLAGTLILHALFEHGEVAAHQLLGLLLVLLEPHSRERPRPRRRITQPSRRALLPVLRRERARQRRGQIRHNLLRDSRPKSHPRVRLLRTQSR